MLVPLLEKGLVLVLVHLLEKGLVLVLVLVLENGLVLVLVHPSVYLWVLVSDEVQESLERWAEELARL